MTLFCQEFADLLTIDRYLKSNAAAFRSGYTPNVDKDEDSGPQIFKYVAHLVALGIHSNSGDIADIESRVNSTHIENSKQFVNDLSYVCRQCMSALPVPKYVAADEISQAMMIDIFLNMLLIYYWLIGDNIVKRAGEFRASQVKDFKLDINTFMRSLEENSEVALLANCVVESAIAHISIIHTIYSAQIYRIYKDLVEFTGNRLPPWLHYSVLRFVADKLWLMSSSETGEQHYDFSNAKSNSIAKLLYVVLTSDSKEAGEDEEKTQE